MKEGKGASEREQLVSGDSENAVVQPELRLNNALNEHSFVFLRLRGASHRQADLGIVYVRHVMPNLKRDMTCWTTHRLGDRKYLPGLQREGRGENCMFLHSLTTIMVKTK